MIKINQDTVSEFVKNGEVVIEASSITGTGAGQGAQTAFDDMGVAMRQWNPFRTVVNAKPIGITKSTAQYNRLTGDELTASAWLPNSVQADTGTVNAIAWTQPMQLLAAYFDVRNAVMNDIPTLSSTLNYDVSRLVGTIEDIAMLQNSDKVTPNSLRGLASYANGAPAYAADGYHTYQSTAYSLAATDDAKYDAVVNMVGSLDGAYWNMPDVAFMCHPAMLTALRKLKSTSGARLLSEVPGEIEFNDYGIRAFLFGIPVIINKWMIVSNQTQLSAGDVPLILGAWDHALEITDGGLTMTRSTQTKPGTTRIYVENKISTTLVNPFAITQLNITA